MTKISIAGDLMCKGREDELLLAKFGRYDFNDYIGSLKPLFADSDYVIGNLETPVCAAKRETENAISFSTPTAFLDAIKAVGFNFLATANNHCLDCGIDGLEETIGNLDKCGFAHDGTFCDQKDADGISLVGVGAMKIAILSSTFGTNSQFNGIMLSPEDEWRVALLKKQAKYRRLPVSDVQFAPKNPTWIADEVSPLAADNSSNLPFLRHQMSRIQRAKSIADVVIALPHVGGQYNPWPGEYAKFVVNECKNAGADVVIAGHPHVSLKCAPWAADNCFVSYSLGNLCSTPGAGWYVPNLLGEYGIVLHLYFDDSKKVRRVTFDVVKCVVDEDGLAHSRPIADIWPELKNATAKDRFRVEVEAVVNRFRGGLEDVEIQREYEFPRCLSQL